MLVLFGAHHGMPNEFILERILWQRRRPTLPLSIITRPPPITQRRRTIIWKLRIFTAMASMTSRKNTRPPHMIIVS